MKATVSIVLLFISISFTSYSQKRLELKNIGFSMNTPKDWLTMNNEEVLENLNKYDFTDKQFQQLLKANKSALDIAIYTKYDAKKYKGIIPTIKIRTNSNPTKSSKEFLNYVEASSESGKKALDDFRFIVKPTIVKISDKDVVKFSVKFSLKNGGDKYEIVSNSYYIPKNGYYISLNFIEQVGKEDNQQFFEQLIKSIKLTK